MCGNDRQVISLPGQAGGAVGVFRWFRPAARCWHCQHLCLCGLWLGCSALPGSSNTVSSPSSCFSPGCATPGCTEGQVTCSSGHCLPLTLLCNGQDDCGDGTDERGCPCPPDSLACADGRCLPPMLLCDGHPDCPDAADEESCLGDLLYPPHTTTHPDTPPTHTPAPYKPWSRLHPSLARLPLCVPNSKGRGQCPGTGSSLLAAGQGDCLPGEVSCADGICVPTFQLCDGVWDCSDGADEGPGHCPLPSLPIPLPGTLSGPSTLATMLSPLASSSPGESS